MQRTDVKASSTVRTAGRLVPVLLAAMLGLFVVWGVGFAGPDVLHNAAHDARHAHAFPCH